MVDLNRRMGLSGMELKEISEGQKSLPGGGRSSVVSQRLAEYQTKRKVMRGEIEKSCPVRRN